MLRASLALMLLGASAAVLAQNGRGIANDASTSCQDLNDRAVAERTADALPAAPDARRARATAVRNKYAAPAAVLSPSPRGGGDDDETPLPRSRGSKWHSFLPGMFR
ncbi:MAG: hypothetical protein U1E00_08030 [Pseudoxanthomonas sp.]|jgi:hypothetical protein|uniref:Secreted protein n=1 Tax=Pseudoxanthomonas mexicana TaxID=128785 RepID=A0ABX6RAF6_PSEMX|nr:hypothetical protein [Pseudoxanthomonas mexicana]MBP7597883.1 hypothetical protein [Pseudoxanthomonas sp.]MBP7657157.1 hypothetical protein [Pseudoxanthomonas sp.]MDZ4048263.1 hypothetical protein [Pseudoxanthomonas sp.]QLQ27206.1 MAG: hypothetical protein HZT39_01960 [Pseudoxanthomonas sp.]QND79806.1 hypothetical protein H4W19_15990 [Pseudoxanthomonas mexicana]